MSAVALVLRTFRVLRIFKLSKVWPQFNFFLTTIANTLTKIGAFSVLLCIFSFMFAILGMELFAQRLRFNFADEQVPYFQAPGNETTSDIWSVPDSNFDSFFNATLSVFIVLANDGWTVIYFDHYRVVGVATSTLFFCGLVLFGQDILFKLFLAILLKEFDESSVL